MPCALAVPRIVQTFCGVDTLSNRALEKLVSSLTKLILSFQVWFHFPAVQSGRAAVAAGHGNSGVFVPLVQAPTLATCLHRLTTRAPWNVRCRVQMK